MDERNPEPPGEHLSNDEISEFDHQIDDFVPKERSYLHFDPPICEGETPAFISDPSQVSSHSFLPFLGFEVRERRFKRENGKTVLKVKTRPIKYASHTDSAIYEFYSNILSKNYEHELQKRRIQNSILAYRTGIGSNIDHAANLFAEIENRQNCICIALDISGFFDNLRHEIIKKNWCGLLDEKKLPEDHFKVFRSLTRYSWVTKKELEDRLGRKLRAVKGNRICSIHEFRERVRQTNPSIIRKNKSGIGIPQGSSLSGLIANFYLLDVDTNLIDSLKKIGASYRRYSDDIAIVAPPGVNPEIVVEMVSDCLQSVGLSINLTKTEVSVFESTDGLLVADRRFQYLGFTFDGQKKLVRDSSLNRYFTKMTLAIRAARISAEKKSIPLDRVFLRRHYKTYTHKGFGRNFVRYAYKAANKMNAPEIRRQLRGHMRIFEAKVRNEFGI